MNTGMYVGNTESHGFHQLASEAIDNSIDEGMAGYAKKIAVILYEDGSVSIEDDGRGIPTEIKPEFGISALEMVLSKPHTGGKFQKKAYAQSGGLHGTGLKCCSALSLWLEATVYRNGELNHQRYLEGKPVKPVEVIGTPDQRGTKILFKPDPKIFRNVLGFDRDWFNKRLRDLSYLNPGIELFLEDRRVTPKFEHRYFQMGGLRDYASSLVTDTPLLKEPFFMSVLEKDGLIKEDGTQDEMRVEAAFTYENSDNEISLCFANNIFNRDGGTHLTGFQTALTFSFNSYLKDHPELISKTEQKELGGKVGLRGEDYRQGLIAIVSVRLARPTFQSQTKDRLTNAETQHAVRRAVQASLEKWIEENPALAKKVLEKAILNFRAHLAGKKAAETVKKDNKSLLGNDRKLKDCTDDTPETNELFIVEGDSAGGSCINGRNPANQAVLPLGGKILNTWKATVAKMLAHDEISALIRSLGTGILDGFESEKCRYGKIIILTDADIDGAHIKVLLLTLFFQRMRKLIEDGKIYIAQPPLYRIQHLYKKEKCSNCGGVAKKMENCGVCTGTGRSTEYIVHDSDFYSIMFGLGKENAVLIDSSGKSYSDELFNSILDACSLQNKTKLASLGFSVPDIDSPKTKIGEIAPIKFTVKNSTKARPIEISHLLKLPQAIIELGQNCVEVTRFKGLGEMGFQEIWTTTMNPDTRTLLQIKIEDVVEATSKFEILMGGKAELRREFISAKKAY